MHRFHANFLDTLAYSLTLLFALDRMAKLAAVAHFFGRPSPAQPERWPTVTLLQPITSGASELPASLRARAHLVYPASIQHLFICDARDTESQGIVRAFLAEFPTLQAELVLVETAGAAVATKIRKLQAALPKASSEVLCFIDDDVAPRPGALCVLVPYLSQPGAGAAFGLPCYTNWRTAWSSLMSALVNANMLLSFVALTYLSDPFRITGHMVVFRRDTFMAVGGLDGLEHHIDDDYELARRLRSHGLRSVQTPLVYDIDNELPSLAAYETQVKRWFVLPRQTMMPSLSAWERLVASLSSATLLLPSIIALMALLTGRPAARRSLGISLGIFGAVYGICEVRYLKGHTPPRRWPWVLLGALITPLQIARVLLANNEVEWRGQRLLIYRDGTMEIGRRGCADNRIEILHI
ncbi:MAG: glycosyltransferase [Ktedonobacteraceae bacterium]|nr:glycosyltransferase [Ktedonobacteraceae bacterium]